MEKSGAPGSHRWRAVLLTGLNAWVAIGLWPLLFAPAPALSLVALGAFLLALGAGVYAMARGTITTRVSWTLLGGCPLALFASVAGRPEALNQAALSPPALVAACLSLLAFVATTAWALDGLTPSSPVSYRPLGPLRWAPPAGPLRRRRALLALYGSGAVLVGLVAPSVGGPEALRQDWGNAAYEGGILTSVVAVALATSIVGIFLAATLSSNQPEAPAAPERRQRVVRMLLASALGGVTYLTVSGGL